MSEQAELINVSRLTEMVQSGTETLTAVAKPINGDLLQGHFLHVSNGMQTWVVSTYLSDKPKHYKRPDALLKEANKIGLSQVLFEL